MKSIEIVGNNYLGYVKDSRKACRAIIIEDDKLLLSYAKNIDQYMLPGGGIEIGESEVECVKRELIEETGYSIEVDECTLEIKEYYEDFLYINHYFVGKVIGQKERHLTEEEIEEGLEPRWVDLEDIISIFASHEKYKNTLEKRSGMYQRELIALNNVLSYPRFIETERLLLRRFKIDDAQKMFDNWANDKEVTKYMTWNPHKDVNETKFIINMWLDEYKKGNIYRFAITLKNSQEIIGSIDVVEMIDNNPVIGYCLSRKYWNNGYMTEACKAMINLLFAEGYTTIRIEADERNIGSNRVIEKCGFKFVRKEYREHMSSSKDEPATINSYFLQK